MRKQNKQFCSYCGNELVDGHSIIVKEVGHGTKQETKLHLCNGHFRQLCRMNFRAPKKLTKRMRRAPWFTITDLTIVEGKRRKQLIYTVPEWDLHQVEAYNRESPEQLLFDKDRNRVWTEIQVREKLKYNRRFVAKCTQLLYAEQTEVEKKEYKTKLSNGNGFNKPDARFGTAMAKLSLDKGYDALSVDQMDKLTELLIKYSNQLAQLLYEEEVAINGNK